MQFVRGELVEPFLGEVNFEPFDELRVNVLIYERRH